MKLRIYRNLNNGLLSVQRRVSNRWLVIGHAEEVTLHNCYFSVSEGQRQKVIKTQSKNVHAFIYGYYKYPSDLIGLRPYKGRWCPDSLVGQLAFPEGNLATYDPYLYDSFVLSQSKLPIYRAKAVTCNNKGRILIHG